MYTTKREFTYYDKYHLTSYGNGAAYALDFVNPDGSVTEVAFLQSEKDVHDFDDALDICTDERDFHNLWESYYYNAYVEMNGEE